MCYNKSYWNKNPITENICLHGHNDRDDVYFLI